MLALIPLFGPIVAVVLVPVIIGTGAITANPLLAATALVLAF